jgi:FkbM family methyltransferase
VKSLISLLIRALRYLFYNTPVKNWRVTEIIYAKVGRLLIGNAPYPILDLEGMKLKANGQDVIITAALANGNYEPFALRIFRQLITDELQKKQRCVFVDIGANIGIFAITAARLDTRVQVIAFEPNVTSYGLLVENIALNQLNNVTPISAAVGDTAGTASLDITSPQAGMHSIYGTGAQRVTVPIVALDGYLAENKLVPDIIKIDVEGYEPRVFLGLKNTLRDHLLRMIIEFNPEHLKKGGKDPEQFLGELLAQFDRVSCLDEIGQRVIPYDPANQALNATLLGTGYNLLLER